MYLPQKFADIAGKYMSKPITLEVGMCLLADCLNFIDFDLKGKHFSKSVWVDPEGKYYKVDVVFKFNEHDDTEYNKFFDVKVSTGKIEYNYAGDEYYV